ncbi:MAG: long-chain fatty acid--CoA ligase [Solirubrobacterales bacterium]
MTNFARTLSDAAAEAGERPAVRLDDLTLDYRTLDIAAGRAAGFLRGLGVGPGDRVGLQLPNVPYFPAFYFGALRLGAVLVPMNPLLKGREVAYYLKDSGAKVLVSWHGFAEAATAGAEEAGAELFLVEPGKTEAALAEAEQVDDVADRDDDDPAVIIYTSGTTGTPKGAVLTHRNLEAGAQVGLDLVGVDSDGVAVATLPLFHVFGMNSIMNVTVKARALLTLVPRFEPGKVLEVIQRDGATVFGGVPTMYTALLHHPDRESFDTASLELCVSGGAAMPVEVLRGFEDAFGCKVLEGYGLSETTGMASFNPPDRERKAGSIGIPVGDTEIKLVDDAGEEVPEGEPGEVLIKGSFVMDRYWEREDATTAVIKDGWLATGDIGTKDEDGYFFIVDRKKDLIIRGGYNVYPREIEEVIYEHPAVREVAVIGVEHPELGEEVAAVIGLADGAEATPEEIQAFAKERVAAYKYPRVVEIVDELPKGPTGKVLKREIDLG